MSFGRSADELDNLLEARLGERVFGDKGGGDGVWIVWRRTSIVSTGSCDRGVQGNSRVNAGQGAERTREVEGERQWRLVVLDVDAEDVVVLLAVVLHLLARSGRWCGCSRSLERVDHLAKLLPLSPPPLLAEPR